MNGYAMVMKIWIVIFLSKLRLVRLLEGTT